jgi:hypothetical protein
MSRVTLVHSTVTNRVFSYLCCVLTKYFFVFKKRVLLICALFVKL